MNEYILYQKQRRTKMKNNDILFYTDEMIDNHHKDSNIDCRSFNYAGYAESEIWELTDKNIIESTCKSDYKGGSYYAMDLCIKKYGYFPRFLPICVSNDHGLCLYKEPTADDDDYNNMPLKLVFNEYRCNILKNKRKYKVETIIFPMIFYRRSKNIKRVENPKGTLIFVGHNYSYQYEIEYTQKLVSKIKSLPTEYSPVCVCVCVGDVFNGYYKYFMESDIPVYTAGSADDVRYPNRFYNLIKNFKYTMGEFIGSHILMSIEMGIPYTYLSEFLLNDDKLLDDYTDAIKISYDLFGNDSTIPSITKEQIAFVNYYSGIEHSISRLKCAKILYLYFFKFLFSRKGLHYIFKILHRFWRKPFYFLRKNHIKQLKEMWRL